MATKQQVIDRLNLFKDDQEFAVTIWTIDDVIGEAASQGYELTKEQAAEIVCDVDRHQDAEIGITWGVLGVYVRDYAWDHDLEQEDGVDSGRAG